MLLKTNKIKPYRSPIYARRIEAAESVKELDLTASFEFVAAEDDKKSPTFKMVANTGIPMRLRGFFDPVIVDLKGAKFAKASTPIIMDHDTSQRVGHTNAQAIDVENNRITVSGPISSSSAAAREFIADAKEGFPFESSIGASILKSTYIPEGKLVTVNGKEWEGPLIVSNRTSIREVSVVVLGADGKTETKVAATQKEDTMNFEEFVASFGLDAEKLSAEQTAKFQSNFKIFQAANPPAPAKKPKKKVKVAAGHDDDDDESEEDDEFDFTAQRREHEAVESERIDSIGELTASYKDSFPEKATIAGKEYKSINSFKAHAIRAGMTADAYELALMRCSRPTDTNQPGMISHTNDLENEVLVAALARKFGLQAGKERWTANCGGDPRKVTGSVPANHQGREYGLEAYFKPDVLEKSHDKKYDGLDSIKALLDVQIRAAGKAYHSFDKNSSDFVAQAVDAYNIVRASGFSTLNVPTILENVMHKFALAAFDSQEQTWRAIAGRKNLNDFRPHNMYRLNWAGHFRKVATDGQLKHISMTDSKYTVQADTYGAMIAIDRKTIRNDDLGGIIAKASSIGMLGAMRIEQSVYQLLLSNPGAFFSTTLGNLITGASSALDQTGASTPATPAGLDKARRAFRNQVINGYPIGLSPQVMLGGTSMETMMYQLWAQETFAIAGVSGSVNWLLNKNEFQGLYRPVITPYLNNTALTDDNGIALSGQSNTQWFLFCNPNLPQGSALVVGFLDGRDQPFFDQADTQFNIPGGIQFRSYLDWGVAMNVYQMAMKSAGA